MLDDSLYENWYLRFRDIANSDYKAQRRINQNRKVFFIYTVSCMVPESGL